MLAALILWGGFLANWMIPNEADRFLTYFNHSILGLSSNALFLCIVLFSYKKKSPSGLNLAGQFSCKDPTTILLVQLSHENGLLLHLQALIARHPVV